MVNIKGAVTLGLMVSTASAALKHDKRHVHHRRAKAPCTTSTIATAPFPASNSTQPAGTGAVSTSTTDAATSSESVITYTVVPVPISSAPASDSTTAVVATSSVNTIATSVASSAPLPSTSAASVVPVPTTATTAAPAPSAPAGGNGGSVCGVATTYVTVQQTVTVTAGQSPVASTSSSSVTVVPSPGAFAQIGGSGGRHHHSNSDSAPAASSVPVPVVPEPSTTEVATTAAPAPVIPSSVASSAPPASTSTAPSSGGSGSCANGGKQGIAWDPTPYGVITPFSSLGKTDGACWAYDWGQGNTVASGVEYVPCLHDADKVANFENDLSNLPGTTWVKHFNEPDVKGGGGCDLSPATAAKMHQDSIAKLQGQYKIGLPSVSAEDSSSGSSGTQFPSGIQWLEAFIKIAGCDFAFADAHWYGNDESVADQAQHFLDYVKIFQTRLNTACPNANFPIWITEVSTYNAADNDAFMQIVAPELEKMDAVARYSSWPKSNALVGSVFNTILQALDI